MYLLAQAVAEYGGLARGGGGSGSIDQAFQRLADASPTEYAVIGVALLLGLFLILKLLDAA